MQSPISLFVLLAVSVCCLTGTASGQYTIRNSPIPNINHDPFQGIPNTQPPGLYPNPLGIGDMMPGVANSNRTDTRFGPQTTRVNSGFEPGTYPLPFDRNFPTGPGTRKDDEDRRYRTHYVIPISSGSTPVYVINPQPFSSPRPSYTSRVSSKWGAAIAGAIAGIGAVIAAVWRRMIGKKYVVEPNSAFTNPDSGPFDPQPYTITDRHYLGLGVDGKGGVLIQDVVTPYQPESTSQAAGS